MKFDLKKFVCYLNNPEIKIEYFEVIDSTNTYLKKASHINNQLIIADFQTAGRGRFNRKWISNPGENLTFSLGLENLPINLLEKIFFLVPVSIIETIESLYDIKLNIKWPNDIVHNSKKICGILIESSIESESKNRIVIGIGINCNQTDFPEEISQRTTSLKLILNKDIDRELLLSNFINTFFPHFEEFKIQPVIFYEKYRERCILLGEEVCVIHNNNEYVGIFSDISQNGELVLQMMNNIIKFNAGEITIKKD